MNTNGANPVATLKALTEKHGEFLNYLQMLIDQARVRHPSRSEFDSQLILEGQAIAAKVLGVECKTRCRPVAVDGVLSAMECTFLAPFEGKDEPVWSMYLKKDGDLYSDAKLQRLLCEYDSETLLATIVSGLTNGLLRSCVFLPTDPTANAAVGR